MSRGAVVEATDAAAGAASVGAVSSAAGSSSSAGSAGAAAGSLSVLGASDVGVVCVVATRVSASAMRIASTADATRAEATGDESTAMGASASSTGEEEGENAANPITATRAMMRRLAYAIGIRGLTCLRGSRDYFRPAGIHHRCNLKGSMQRSTRAVTDVLGSGYRHLLCRASPLLAIYTGGGIGEPCGQRWRVDATWSSLGCQRRRRGDPRISRALHLATAVNG